VRQQVIRFRLKPGFAAFVVANTQLRTVALVCFDIHPIGSVGFRVILQLRSNRISRAQQRNDPLRGCSSRMFADLHECKQTGWPWATETIRSSV